MPQIKIFPCPSCGANLSYDGGSEITFPCQYCGTTITVPEEFRQPAEDIPASTPYSEVQNSAEQDKAGQPAAPSENSQWDDVRQLALAGKKIDAIKLYRMKTGAGLADAKNAVEQMMAGQPIPIELTSLSLSAPESYPGLQASDLDEMKQMALSGNKIEAIKLYRMKTGVGLLEAKNAVEQLAAGQPVNISTVQTTETQVGDRAALWEDVKRLAQNGQKIEAIKLFRQISGVGLIEAKTAVEQIAVGQTVDLSHIPQATKQPRITKKARNLGTAGCILFALPILAFVLGIAYLPFRLSGSFQQAVDAARTDPAVIEELGAPVEPSIWPTTGEISCGGSRCDADYSIPIHGSRKTGRIRVMSYSNDARLFNEGTWILDAEVIVDGSNASHPLKPSQSTTRPISTLSPAQVESTQGPIDRATRSARSTATEAAIQGTAEVQNTTATAASEATDIASQYATVTMEAATAQAKDLLSLKTIIPTQNAWPLSEPADASNPFNGWPTGLREDKFLTVTTTIQTTRYLLAVSPKQDGAYFNYKPVDNKAVSDFYTRVDLQFGQGDAGNSYAYGLAFRQTVTSDGNTYGFCGIENDGSYRFLEVKADSLEEEYEDTNPAILTQPGAVNHLAVRAVGHDFYCLVNDVLIGHIIMDIPAGVTGLGVDVWHKGKPATVEFTHFELYVAAP